MPPKVTPKGHPKISLKVHPKMTPKVTLKVSQNLTELLETPLSAHLEIWQQTLQWQPSAVHLSQFQCLYEGIVRGNQQFNLTRLTSASDFWEKHLWDSLSGVAPWLGPALPAWAGPVAAVVDIGTGAGFPGIPVAIAMPLQHLTLLDATRKKIQFLEETLAPALPLSHLACVAERAETVGHDPTHRDRYDLALVRAVGTAATCAEYAIPLLKLGGIAVLFRGQWTESDTLALVPALDQLGATLVTVTPWITPLTQGVRHCLYLQKIAATADHFPRRVGIPAKEPLF